VADWPPSALGPVRAPGPRRVVRAGADSGQPPALRLCRPCTVLAGACTAPWGFPGVGRSSCRHPHLRRAGNGRAAL